MTLDGRVVVPGERWVTGEASRRRVHELRAAIGRGRGRDGHRPRRRPTARRARRPTSCASRGGSPSAPGRCPDGSELELRTGPLGDELRALAGEGVQSLLLEGGPTLGDAFLAEGLVDKLLLFVAPTLCWRRVALVGDLAGPIALRAAHGDARRRRRAARGIRPRAMSTLPAGTVTFLFTDVEGSTRLLDELGKRATRRLSSNIESSSATRSLATAVRRSTRRATRSSSLFRRRAGAGGGRRDTGVARGRADTGADGDSLWEPLRSG